MVLRRRSGRFSVPAIPVAIDWTHPLANGLIGCWLPGLGGQDITQKSAFLTPVASFAGSNATTVEGAGLKSAAANSGLTGLANAAYKNGNMTIYWRGLILGAPDNGANYFGVTYDNAAGSPFLITSIATNGSSTTLVGEYNTSGTFQVTTGPAQPTSGFHDFAFVTPNSGFGNYTLYLDGVASGSGGVGSSAPTSSATSTIMLNTYAGAATRNTNAIANMCCAWSRVLSAQEIFQLHLDPYCFFMSALWPGIDALGWVPPLPSGPPPGITQLMGQQVT